MKLVRFLSLALLLLLTLILVVSVMPAGATDLCDDDPEAPFCQGDSAEPCEWDPALDQDDERCFEPPPLDCAAGPDPGSEEWHEADEWREMCEVGLGEATVLVRPDEGSDADPDSGEELPRTGSSVGALVLLGSSILAGGVALASRKNGRASVRR